MIVRSKMPQQSELDALISERDYITELLESDEIQCAEQSAKMSCRLKDLEAEITEAISWS